MWNKLNPISISDIALVNQFPNLSPLNEISLERKTSFTLPGNFNIIPKILLKEIRSLLINSTIKEMRDERDENKEKENPATGILGLLSRSAL